MSVLEQIRTRFIYQMICKFRFVHKFSLAFECCLRKNLELIREFDILFALVMTARSIAKLRPNITRPNLFAGD
jgi:hypothetical protein